MTDTRALAAYVVLRSVDDYEDGHCAAWMDSADRTCGKWCTGILCPRHERVALRRMEKERAKQRDQQQRELQRLAPHLDGWIAERDRLTAELDRVTSLRRHDTDDMAAYGGIGIRQTERQRRQYARRFDRALDRYRELSERIEWLDAKIARTRKLMEASA